MLHASAVVASGRADVVLSVGVEILEERVNRNFGTTFVTRSYSAQVEGDAPLKWAESPGLADSFVKVKDAQGIVDGNAHVYRRVMRGVFENKDVAV